MNTLHTAYHGLPGTVEVVENSLHVAQRYRTKERFCNVHWEQHSFQLYKVKIHYLH